MHLVRIYMKAFASAGKIRETTKALSWYVC